MPMIVNSAGTHAVSNVRWVDGGSLWSYVLGDSEPRRLPLSEAAWLSIVQGNADYFAAVHHREDSSVRLTAHSFQAVAETISSVELQIGNDESNDVSKLAVARFTGERTAWASLPRAYIIRALGERLLLLLDWSHGTVQVQPLSWYKESYDTMYQGILSVTEVPGSHLLIIPIQRDSEPLLFDPTTNKVVQKLALAGRKGNPQLYFRRTAPELWASDYDTLVRLDSRNWSILNALKLQQATTGMARVNIAQYCFDQQENLCVVARPHSGDIVGIDPNSFTVTARAETGGQPEDVGLLRAGFVVARDLKTGRLLQATLQPV